MPHVQIPQKEIKNVEILNFKIFLKNIIQELHFGTGPIEFRPPSENSENLILYWIWSENPENQKIDFTFGVVTFDLEQISKM